MRRPPWSGACRSCIPHAPPRRCVAPPGAGYAETRAPRSYEQPQPRPAHPRKVGLRRVLPRDGAPAWSDPPLRLRGRVPGGAHPRHPLNPRRSRQAAVPASGPRDATLGAGRRIARPSRRQPPHPHAPPASHGPARPARPWLAPAGEHVHPDPGASGPRAGAAVRRLRYPGPGGLAARAQSGTVATRPGEATPWKEGHRRIANPVRMARATVAPGADAHRRYVHAPPAGVGQPAGHAPRAPRAPPLADPGCVRAGRPRARIP